MFLHKNTYSEKNQKKFHIPETHQVVVRLGYFEYQRRTTMVRLGYFTRDVTARDARAC